MVLLQALQTTEKQRGFFPPPPPSPYHSELSQNRRLVAGKEGSGGYEIEPKLTDVAA